MESTAPPEPAGRNVGPFRGVTTVRVHGGYEICRGKDDTGRKVTILTMGPSAAKIPGLRDTLRDAYDQVRMTAAPGRDEFFGADLAADQPWIASLDGPGGTAGVRRLFDRLVSSVRPPAPGRHTGQIPRVTDAAPTPRTFDTGRLPRVGDTGQIPRVGDTGQLPQVGNTGQIPRVDNTGRVPGTAGTGRMPPTGTTGPIPRPGDTGQLPRVGDTGQFPRVPPPARPPAAVPPPAVPPRGPAVAPPPPPQHRPPTDQTWQLRRISDPGVRPPGIASPPGPPPTARELTRPPMPAYQGPVYTAAPRPIALPPASGLPGRPASSGLGSSIPVAVLALGLITFGALVVLVAILVLLF